MSWDEVVGGIAAAATPIVEGTAAYYNYQQQQETLDWQKQMQMTAWSREDNAVQRRVADLKSAGLNPVLAAGSAAQSSSPIHLNAPQFVFA